MSEGTMWSATVNKSEQINELAAALAKAQGELVNPSPDASVTVRSEKGSYAFKYATLGTIVEGVRPVLAKHGLSVILWDDEAADGGPVHHATLTHASGQWFDSHLRLGGFNKMQELGSQLSYLHRYLLRGLLNLATDEDDDANIADRNEHSRNDKAPQRARSSLPNLVTRASTLPPAKTPAEKLSEALMAIDAAKDLTQLGRVYAEVTVGRAPEFIEACKSKAGARKVEIQAGFDAPLPSEMQHDG